MKYPLELLCVVITLIYLTVSDIRHSKLDSLLSGQESSGTGEVTSGSAQCSGPGEDGHSYSHQQHALPQELH